MTTIDNDHRLIAILRGITPSEAAVRCGGNLLFNIMPIFLLGGTG